MQPVLLGRLRKNGTYSNIWNILLALTRQPSLKSKHTNRHSTHVLPAKDRPDHHLLRHRSIVMGNACQMTRPWMSPSFVTHLENHCVFLGVAAVAKGDMATLQP